jgi:antitoxin component YwqK of YwqJK toxin-antitoxin module
MFKQYVLPFIIVIVFAANLGCFFSRQNHDRTYPIRDGKSTVFYKNGTKKIEGNYIKGKKEGVFNYYRDDGTLESKVTFKGNKKNGLTSNFGLKDKLEEEIIFKNDLKNGTQKFYNENGVSIKQIEWHNDKEIKVTQCEIISK